MSLHIMDYSLLVGVHAPGSDAAAAAAAAGAAGGERRTMSMDLVRRTMSIDSTRRFAPSFDIERAGSGLAPGWAAPGGDSDIDTAAFNPSAP
jgi:hypothetical protein